MEINTKKKDTEGRDEDIKKTLIRAYNFGATILIFVILAVALPLFIRSNHGVSKNDVL
jgi:hypothetical protein